MAFYRTKPPGTVSFHELRVRVPDDGRVAGVRKVIEDAISEAERIYGAHSGEVATLREIIEEL